MSWGTRPEGAMPRLVRFSDPTENREQMARGGVLFFVVGAALTLVALLLPHDPAARELGLIAVAGGCLAGAAVALAGSQRLPSGAFLALAAYSTLLATGARWFAENHGEAGAGVQMLYLWICLYAFYFFGRWQAIGLVALMGVEYGAVLVGEVSAEQVPSGGAVTLWAVTIVGLLLAGLVVGFLRERVVELIHELEGAARTDALTGVLNRRGFDERFADELTRARRSGGSLGLLVGDLDRFKQVNDRHGHPAGDRALVCATQVLADGKRSIDALARLGGEEFSLLMPDSDLAAAHAAAERLRLAVSGAFGSKNPPITVSFGVVAYPASGQSASELYAAADEALYEAKASGRDRTVSTPRAGKKRISIVAAAEAPS